jgi:hypothetical protein
LCWLTMADHVLAAFVEVGCQLKCGRQQCIRKAYHRPCRPPLKALVSEGRPRWWAEEVNPVFGRRLSKWER